MHTEVSKMYWHTAWDSLQNNAAGRQQGVEGIDEVNGHEFMLVVSGLPWQLSGKESTCQYRRCRRCGFDLWVSQEDSGGRNGNPLQYSCLENSIRRGACWTTVHGVPKSQTQLKTRARARAHTHTYRAGNRHIHCSILSTFLCCLKSL